MVVVFVWLVLVATTHDQDVFSFFPDDAFCNGFEQVLSRYREIVPQLSLAGPTSFAPIIERAMTIVEESGGQYHVLLIIADGQVKLNKGFAFSLTIILSHDRLLIR